VKDRQKIVKILIADDDEDDSLLVREAFAESKLIIELNMVRDGEELMNYLHCQGEYADGCCPSPPSLIFLDLNMPKKGGLEVLKEIKLDPNLRRIPVIVLTTSMAEEDIYKTYDFGASSFIIKPVSFASLVEMMKNIIKYWFEIVQLPVEAGGSRGNQR